MNELSHLHIQALEELVEEIKQVREQYEKALRTAEIKAAKLDVRKTVFGEGDLTEEELNWRGHGFSKEKSKLQEEVDRLSQRLSQIEAQLNDARHLSAGAS
jgi:hypothetical protein